MATTRTFIAVEICDRVRKRAGELIQQLAPTEAKVKWVDLPNMHVTLKFLGDLTDPQVAAVCQAVQQAGREVPPFTFRCHGAGAFPGARHPRTVWIGVDEGVEAFRRLHAAVDERLGKIGIPRDRRAFRPHLTIGRVRSGGAGQHALGERIAAFQEFEVGEVAVDQVLVLASHLKRTGPLYETLATAPLTGSVAADEAAG